MILWKPMGSCDSLLFNAIHHVEFCWEVKPMNTKSIYSGTPTISVIDNRNLEIRTLQYNRIAAENLADEYILRNTYTLLGSLESSMDPRLFAQYQEDSGIPPNLRTIASLRGEALRTESVDAGRKAEHFDIEGRPVWLIDANGTQTTLEYDILGRPTAVFEQQEGKEFPQFRDRFIYGENETDAQANNLRGQLVRHYDTAGRIQTGGFSLAGRPLHQNRQLLKNMDQPGDWITEDESAWAHLLAAESYETNWRYDAQDRVLAQTDAKGNLRKITYDVAGQPQAVSLTLQGQEEQRIWNRIEYNAAGQMQVAEAGNGVITEYTYEESTQRLIRKKDCRGLSSGEGEVLQDYRYEYDPVGNILSICNEAEPVRYFRNQAVAPKRQYAYDALYQLVSSSGRESDALRQQPSLPPLITPIPLDDSQYVNYAEKYSYDRAGNLIKLSHNGASQYTTNVYVDKRSNRGIWRQGEDIPDVAASFDRAGNQRALFPGRPLEWDTRNQLSRVHMVVREGEDNDWEDYLYDSSGMRIVKRSTRKTQTTTQTDMTIYLPGLELRIRQTGNRITEALQVVTVDVGAGQVRVLHWEEGTDPGGIANDHYRYSLHDHLGSSLLEVDRQGQIISKEEFYPYGGTALWAARTEVEASYKTTRYSGKELDATGLYYYGYRYYMPWLGRWLNPDPAGTVDGLNLYRMVRNNPVTFLDDKGLKPEKSKKGLKPELPYTFTTSLSEPVDSGEESSHLSSMTLNRSSIKIDNDGTVWENIKENFEPIETRLIETAIEFEKKYKPILSRKELGPAIAVVYNKKTENLSTAFNHPEGKLPEQMHPRIEERIRNMPEAVRKSYEEMTRGAGSHAEVYASNRALLEHPDTGAEDIIIYVNRVNEPKAKPAEIRPFITCPHCEYILEGLNVVSNKFGKWMPNQSNNMNQRAA
ncbi:RHS repeat-associated core domain-containing protein [Paenibacillus thiaminolyticus]|uniref:RHS repeat-associated core domain-containing protein n=1 Tax=Paenibacillus thiaminolyticus TaxID=49283 RepID=UPI0035A63B57